AAVLARLLAEHHTSDLTIAEICRLADLNPNYATGLFKKSLGIGLQEQLTRHRVATAKRLLVTTDRTILDIANASGFGSQTRFYAGFAKHVGVPPVAWREQMRNVSAHART
ncbi:MAG: helix-turn-helix domain-containing protein, partial [Planctomycetota bacterium]